MIWQLQAAVWVVLLLVTTILIASFWGVWASLGLLILSIIMALVRENGKPADEQIETDDQGRDHWRR